MIFWDGPTTWEHEDTTRDDVLPLEIVFMMDSLVVGSSKSTMDNVCLSALILPDKMDKWLINVVHRSFKCSNNAQFPSYTIPDKTDAIWKGHI